MMTCHLRKDCGGRLNPRCFVACMEFIWNRNPRHIICNIQNIMEDTSVKWGLVLLKHFSNPDELHPNNYWGNLAMADARKEHVKAYRGDKKYDKPSWDAHTVKQQRRLARFQGHLCVVEEFSKTLDTPFNGGALHVMQPKANLKAKKSFMQMQVLEPKNELVKEKFDRFFAVYDIWVEWKQEEDTMYMLDCGYYGKVDAEEDEGVSSISRHGSSASVASIEPEDESKAREWR